MSRRRPVAVVTGASRGAGLGIAHALGGHGCTVYVTGRTERTGQSSLTGTIHQTAALVTSAGGNGIAVRVDHSDDKQTKALFDQIHHEQGRLDILVNNAAIIRDEMMGPTKFWEEPINVIDTLDVGLRSGYVATVYAAPLMLPQRKGLVVFTSASGAVHYTFGPAYGVHKAGLEKMAADMAVDFKDFGIATVSIWMGALLTERLKKIVASNPEKRGHVLDTAETPELTGHVIWALYNDLNLMEVTGRTLIGAEMADAYGINDDRDREVLEKPGGRSARRVSRKAKTDLPPTATDNEPNRKRRERTCGYASRVNGINVIDHSRPHQSSTRAALIQPGARLVNNSQ